jgi:hypothetical protein
VISLGLVFEEGPGTGWQELNTEDYIGHCLWAEASKKSAGVCVGGSMSSALGFCKRGLDRRKACLRRVGSRPPDTCFSPLSLVLDGMLYSGTMNNFLGSEPILMRTLGSQPVLKTDIFLRWLHGKSP